MKSLVLFDNTGRLGATALTFNIAHMMARIGVRTVVLDYDPRCNLSTAFLGDEALMEVWRQEEGTRCTVADCIAPLHRGERTIVPPRLTEIGDDLWLLPGHLSLDRFEQRLADEWPKISAGDGEHALDLILALSLLAKHAAGSVGADLVLLDIGSRLSALNRAALLACDALLIPVAPDLFSVHALRNVGLTIREWRADAGRFKESALALGAWHDFHPIGYLVQQHPIRVDRPTTEPAEYALSIPSAFHRFVLNEDPAPRMTIGEDPECVAQLRSFAGLIPMAQQVRKPLFDLTRADGVGSGGGLLVAQARREFESLARAILSQMKIAAA